MCNVYNYIQHLILCIFNGLPIENQGPDTQSASSVTLVSYLSVTSIAPRFDCLQTLGKHFRQLNADGFIVQLFISDRL